MRFIKTGAKEAGLVQYVDEADEAFRIQAGSPGLGTETGCASRHSSQQVIYPGWFRGSLDSAVCREKRRGSFYKNLKEAGLF